MTAESDANQSIDDSLNRLDEMAIANIEMHGKWIRDSAERIKEYAPSVRFRRPYETRMEDALSTAEVALWHALTGVREAREQYKTKPLWKPGQ